MASWERQPGEPERAYARFSALLDLGPQGSLTRLARLGMASLSHLKKLSARWRWQERAADWRAHLAGQVQAVVSDPGAEARQRLLRDAQTMQRLAWAQIVRGFRSADGRSRIPPQYVAALWRHGFAIAHELLPRAVTADLPQAQGQQPPEGSADAPFLPFDQAMARLLARLRRAGVPTSQLPGVRARLLRWLWLPEDLAPEPCEVEAMADPPHRRADQE